MGQRLHISKMALKASYAKKTFHFSFRARTSRGSMYERDSWFLKIADEGKQQPAGIGEAGPLPGLSVELDDQYEEVLARFVKQFDESKFKWDQFTISDPAKCEQLLSKKLMDIRKYPSILFAFETAILDLIGGGKKILFNNSFTTGDPIDINGLIWMSGLDMTLQQIEIKIQEGFNCIKLKVGGLDFEKECDILQYVRRKYFKKNISVRLDANGAFKSEEAMFKLHQLSKFDIHSIEQPIKAGLPEMADFCQNSPIPVALDEELIGIHALDKKKELIERLSPKFIVLKPSLHGGLSGSREWIDVAEAMGIGWWMTSALESNIGLNAIAQFAAQFKNPLHQGLGTGKIYEDNFESPLEVKNGKLNLNTGQNWGITVFD